MTCRLVLSLAAGNCLQLRCSGRTKRRRRHRLRIRKADNQEIQLLLQGEMFTRPGEPALPTAEASEREGRTAQPSITGRILVFIPPPNMKAGAAVIPCQMFQTTSPLQAWITFSPCFWVTGRWPLLHAFRDTWRWDSLRLCFFDGCSKDPPAGIEVRDGLYYNVQRV